MSAEDASDVDRGERVVKCTRTTIATRETIHTVARDYMTHK